MIPILITFHFFKQLKKLKKKYPHIKADLLTSLEVLDLRNEIHIGKSIYKVRICSTDIAKGKSGAMRSYIYFYRKKTVLVPMVIYSKNEKDSLTQKELEYNFDLTIMELKDRFK